MILGMEKLRDVVMERADATLVREPHGDARFYFEGKTDLLKAMTAGSLVLKPGMSPHPPHQHPEEEFMLVTEGTGEIQVAEETTPVGPGAMMYCAGNQLHGIKNTGRVPMTFYFYKWLA
jgi:quercetin dioxygenase-like cupin family protein